MRWDDSRLDCTNTVQRGVCEWREVQDKDRMGEKKECEADLRAVRYCCGLEEAFLHHLGITSKTFCFRRAESMVFGW